MFVTTSTVVLVVVVLGALIGSGVLTRSEAVRDAEHTADRVARVLVAPVQDRLRAGDPATLAALDAAVRARIDGNVLRAMVVWRHDGSIAYASGPVSVTGPSFGDGLLEAMAGRTHTEITDDDDLGLLPVEDSLIEVYLPVPRAGGQPPLVVEIYVSSEQLATRVPVLARQLGLLGVLPVLLLTAVQLPIACRLARRVGRQDRQRAQLLQRTLSASDRERRAVAADLHDGVVQDLAGAVYVLAGLSRAVPAEQRPMARAAEAAVRGGLDELRRLMTEIVPQRIDSTRLPAALGELADRHPRGPAVHLAVGTPPACDDEVASLAFRVAQEGLQNVVKHAGATTVRIELGEGVLGTLRVAVVDDGVGIAPSTAAEPPAGHLGLTLLRDRLTDVGGTLTVGPAEGGGTALVALLPPEEPSPC
ncbi:sensor histidine kinase [Pseudonocardia alni]|uniref:sensor histidine kinase n=1 Tax=Pseudonocardia alni TaxID=33907 RepID=UPI003317C0C5